MIQTAVILSSALMEHIPNQAAREELVRIMVVCIERFTRIKLYGGKQ